MSDELEPLTARQAETLDAVRRLSAAQGYPPTLRELAKELGNTSTAVHVTLKRLMRKGHVTMRPGISRSVVVTRASLDSAFFLPPAAAPVPVRFAATPAMTQGTGIWGRK